MSKKPFTITTGIVITLLIFASILWVIINQRGKSDFNELNELRSDESFNSQGLEGLEEEISGSENLDSELEKELKELEGEIDSLDNNAFADEPLSDL